MSRGQLDLAETSNLLSKASFDKGISKSLLRVEYQEALDPRRLQFPEELVSLYHHPVYKSLTDEQRWRLGVAETVSFFSLNIHGERNLVHELVLRCHAPSELGNSPQIHEYLQHFIHEENAHTFMLAGYCNRYGGGVLRDAAFSVETPPLSPTAQEALTFGRTFVLESFLDFLNCEAMRDDKLDTTVRQIHRIHHIDEARHMSFDKTVLQGCIERLKEQGQDAEVTTVATSLAAYGRYALRRLANPSVYKGIGLSHPTALAREVEELPERVVIEQRWLAAGRNFLRGIGLDAPLVV
jgi:hypothetical protein